jgi:hypothetical protein
MKPNCRQWSEAKPMMPNDSRLEQPTNSPEPDLLAGYREMANDQEHNSEALEWCDALIGDALP